MIYYHCNKSADFNRRKDLVMKYIIDRNYRKNFKYTLDMSENSCIVGLLNSPLIHSMPYSNREIYELNDRDFQNLTNVELPSYLENDINILIDDIYDVGFKRVIRYNNDLYVAVFDNYAYFAAHKVKEINPIEITHNGIAFCNTVDYTHAHSALLIIIDNIFQDEYKSIATKYFLYDYTISMLSSEFSCSYQTINSRVRAIKKKLIKVFSMLSQIEKLEG